MSQPTPYTRQADFTDLEALDDHVPGTELDAEMDAIKLTLDEILENLELIQRDDTALANQTVGLDQLDAELLISWGIASIWATATAYAVDDVVAINNALYICATAHTSGTFATDLSAAKWTLAVDFGATVFTATSTTSLAIGTGSKAFTVSNLSDKNFPVGTWVLAVSDANPTVNYMSGQVTANSGTTLTVNMTSTGGSGTLADWTIRMAGPTGATGSAGSNGQGVPTGGTAAQVLSKIDGTNYNTQWVTLGTAASAATGTSGAAVPLLNTACTWSDNMTIAKASATAGITVSRTTTNAADGVLRAVADKIEIGSTSADNVSLIANGTEVARATSGGGIIVGSPTGGDQGAGKINCTGLYVNGALATNVIVDRAYTSYATNAALSTTIPADDTIPTNIEGTEIMTASITPKSATNRVRITVTLWGSATATTLMIAALYKDSGAAALAVSCGVAGSVSVPGCWTFIYEEVPGDTSAHTYKIRVGGSTGTIRLNGTTSARLFGGVGICTMIIEEIAA